MRIMVWVRCLTLLAAASLVTVRPAAGAGAVTVRIGVEANELRLSWDPGDPGTRFTVESASRLDVSDWQPLGGAAGWPTLATQWTGPLPAISPTFFRVAAWVPSVRGSLESSGQVRSFTVAEMKALMGQYNLPALSAYAVEAWKVVYHTIDPDGQPTRASALVVFPVGAPGGRPLVSYQHGTLTLREDAPSRLVGEADIGLILAAGGYVAVLPDYLGLGDSPGLHPYQHAASEATAVVDALRAARRVAGTKNQPLSGQLFLTGYSQGGHATLAAQRDLELLHADEFTLTASAPGAGAYDMSGTVATDFLSGRVPPNPYYSAYLLAAYVEVYDDLAPNLASLLRSPYDATVPPLFDGTHGSGAINAAVPSRPTDLLRPELLADFTADLEHPLRQALRDNDLHRGWYPRVPTRFYHCAGDKDVLPANSDVAFNAFKAAGAPAVERIDPLPFADHGQCAPFALYATKLWFDSLVR